jgi:hypothetical protein
MNIKQLTKCVNSLDVPWFKFKDLLKRAFDCQSAVFSQRASDNELHGKNTGLQLHIQTINMNNPGYASTI